MWSFLRQLFVSLLASLIAQIVHHATVVAIAELAL